jgi:hypothetical protein
MASKLIHVEFVDESTGKIFGAYDAPPETLPETFAIGTKLHIGDQDWDVVKAEPLTRAEYLQSGKLRLTLAKIMMMPVKDILYTLPTIYDAIPADSTTPRAGKQVFEMHEDNWRQIEFVASTNQPAIETELRAIANIYDNHRDSGGFNQLHIRKTPQSPLTVNFSRQDLEKLFLGASAYEGTAYQGNLNLMSGTFAFRYGKLIFYGAETTGQVSVLGLTFLRDGQSLPLEPIIELMKTYRLFLVDWCRVGAFTANDVVQYLQKMGL